MHHKLVYTYIDLHVYVHDTRVRSYIYTYACMYVFTVYTHIDDVSTSLRQVLSSALYVRCLG